MTHTFVVDDALKTQRWLTAFPDAHVINMNSDNKATAVDASAGDFLWVTTSLHHWRDIASHANSRGVFVIALTPQESAEENLQAIKAGCRGYAHIFSTAKVLKTVASSIETGSVWLNHNLLSSILSRVEADKSSSGNTALETLSPREREVAILISEGHSNKQVAQELQITERTVKAHLTKVYERLQVSGRLELVVFLNQATSSRGTTNDPDTSFGM